MKDELDPEVAESSRRTRALLERSVDELPAGIRSRLTRARYAALERGNRPGPHAGNADGAWRRWLPAGAAAGAVLVVLLVQAPRFGPDLPKAASAGAEDLELLADGGGYALAQDPLSQDADVDYEFYDWAVATAQDERYGEAGP